MTLDTSKRLGGFALAATLLVAACSSGTGATTAPSVAAPSAAASSEAAPSAAESMEAPASAAAGAVDRHDQRLRLVDGRADLDRRSPRHRQGGQPRLQLHGRRPRHRRRLQDLLRGRDRHQRRLAQDQGRGGRDLCKAAGIEYIELKIAYRRHDRHDLARQHRRHLPVSFADLYALIGPRVAGLRRSGRDAAALAKELGSNTAFPDAALSITGPGEESGTYDSFVELALTADRRDQSASQARHHAPDYTASANDNAIIDGIAHRPELARLGRLRLRRGEQGQGQGDRRRQGRRTAPASRRPPRPSPTAATRSRAACTSTSTRPRRRPTPPSPPTSTTTSPTARSRRSSRPSRTSTCRPTSSTRPRTAWDGRQ